jgi:hypothetical protein
MQSRSGLAPKAQSFLHILQAISPLAPHDAGPATQQSGIGSADSRTMLNTQLQKFGSKIRGDAGFAAKIVKLCG